MLDKANDALIGSRTTLSSLSKAAQLNYATKIVKIWSLRWSRCRDCPWGLWPCRVNCRWRVFKETQDKNGLFQEKKKSNEFFAFDSKIYRISNKKVKLFTSWTVPNWFYQKKSRKIASQNTSHWISNQPNNSQPNYPIPQLARDTM